MHNIAKQIKKELKQTNQILSFDKKFLHRNKSIAKTADDNLELALAMIQSESHEYLRGIKLNVQEKNLRVAGSTLRSLLESTANAQWLVEDKSGKRASRYINSTKGFIDYVNKTGNKQTLTIEKLPKEVTSWTTSSAEDRINLFSPQAGVVWDYCSIFTHASPSYIALQDGLDKVLCYVISQANTYALTARLIIKQDSNIYDTRERKFLDSMANEMLTRLGMIV